MSEQELHEAIEELRGLDEILSNAASGIEELPDDCEFSQEALDLMDGARLAALRLVRSIELVRFGIFKGKA